MSALPVTITVKSFVLFFCKFSPPKKKFARKKGHSTKERNVFVNFFLLCYALESSRPRLDFPLEDHGAAIYSSTSFTLVSLQRLSILSFLSYLSDRFIKSSLIPCRSNTNLPLKNVSISQQFSIVVNSLRVQRNLKRADCGRCKAKPADNTKTY